jgi:hypothetical protein
VSAAAYRARSATELIDATFQILRRNAAGLLTLSALFTIPNTILNVTLTRSALLRPGIAASAAATAAAGYNFAGFGLYFLCLLVLSAVFHTAIIIACSDAYLGKEVDIADALKRALPKAFTIFVAYIALSIIIFIGFIFFVIPGIILSLMYYATACAILFENLDLGQAMARSSALSKDLKGHEMATFSLATVIYIVAYFIIAAIAGLGLAISPFLYLILLALGLTLVMPIYPLVVVLLYYDARIRKEGYDIELMAQQVGGPAATAAKPQPKPA